MVMLSNNKPADAIDGQTEKRFKDLAEISWPNRVI